MRGSVNESALAAKADPRARDNFIRAQEQTILKTASRILGRYITTSDDEWSVSLCAFSRAIDTFDADQGDFLSYAGLLIRRDLIDEHRRNAKYQNEIVTAPEVLEGNAEPEDDPEHVLQAVALESMRHDEGTHSLREEILAASEEFRPFGFGFFDLTECSPRQDRTRKACAVVLRWLMQNPSHIDKIRKTGQLPQALIRRETHASEKLLEHYRKYLLASVLIMSGDYPQLQEYLLGMRVPAVPKKEGGKDS